MLVEKVRSSLVEIENILCGIESSLRRVYNHVTLISIYKSKAEFEMKRLTVDRGY